MATLRETEDKLYNDYQTVLEGRKSLTLNRERAEHIFNQMYVLMPKSTVTMAIAPIFST